MTTIHNGEIVAGGVALGYVRFVGYDARTPRLARVSSDQLDEELNRLRSALDLSRAQIEGLKEKHSDSLSDDEVRIFDVHLAYLSDPMFIEQIEKLVLQERFSVEAAIAKVTEDYDRIFELVEDERLRERAGDLRDVATRVLRNLDDGPAPVDAGEAASKLPDDAPVVLAARRLTVNELFLRDGEAKVAAIVSEAGGISSHAGILARSLGIPALTGIADLSSKLEDGAFVVVDAGAGELIVDPDERLKAEYEQSAERTRGLAGMEPPRADEDSEFKLRCGTPLQIYGACGSTSEVTISRTFGMSGVGVFRTELMFLIEKGRIPSDERLAHHYAEVCRGPADERRAFRLLDVTASHDIAGLPRRRERNPALGQRGVRLLLDGGRLLRQQLRAILRATAESERASILVPFVTGVGDLQRVRAAAIEERQELRREKIPTAPRIEIAPIIEVPAAAFVLDAFLHESDYAVVAIDDLQALLFAADRDNMHVQEYNQSMHPALFELLARMAKVAQKHDKELVLFGEGAADPVRLPFFYGIGIRSFAVAPSNLRTMVRSMQRFSAAECEKIARRVLNKPRALDVQRVLVPLAEKA